MIFFKACPRCHGDLHINQDMYGQYKECLQCGYMVDVNREHKTGGDNLRTLSITPPKKKKSATCGG